MSAAGTKRATGRQPASEKPGAPDQQSVSQPSISAHSIDTASRTVSARFTKRLSFSDIRSYAFALRYDPQFDPAFSEIVDLREVEEVDLSPEELMVLADSVDPFSPVAKRAFVAQGPAQINAAQLHHILRPEASNVRVFFSMDAAQQWIAAES